MKVFALTKRIVPFVVTFTVGVFIAGLFVSPAPNGGGISAGPAAGNSCSADLSRVCIISKPKAAYTDGARTNNTEGHVTLKITFLANGTVGNVQVVEPLPYGLTENAIQAAKSIKFRPKMVNGQPVNTVMTFQYGFNIY